MWIRLRSTKTSWLTAVSSATCSEVLKRLNARIEDHRHDEWDKDNQGAEAEISAEI